jgi:hypothetical protein
MARLKDAVWTDVTTEAVVPQADRPVFNYNTPLPFQGQVGKIFLNIPIQDKPYISCL